MLKNVVFGPKNERNHQVTGKNVVFGAITIPTRTPVFVRDMHDRKTLVVAGRPDVVSVSFSAGLAFLSEIEADSPDEAVRRLRALIEVRLYEAKAAGRDRVIGPAWFHVGFGESTASPTRFQSGFVENLSEKHRFRPILDFPARDMP